MPVRTLTQALRATGKPACIALADRLDGPGTTAARFDLHLRRAGLDSRDAASLAAAIGGLDDVSIRSFSVSYNPGIGNAGAVALIGSLPSSVAEVGMVGCDLDDASAEALLHWAATAPALGMLCVEGNRFSEGMRGRVSALRSARPGLVVIV